MTEAVSSRRDDRLTRRRRRVLRPASCGRRAGGSVVPGDPRSTTTGGPPHAAAPPCARRDRAHARGRPHRPPLARRHARAPAVRRHGHRPDTGPRPGIRAGFRRSPAQAQAEPPVAADTPDAEVAPTDPAIDREVDDTRPVTRDWLSGAPQATGRGTADATRGRRRRHGRAARMVRRRRRRPEPSSPTSSRPSGRPLIADSDGDGAGHPRRPATGRRAAQRAVPAARGGGAGPCSCRPPRSPCSRPPTASTCSCPPARSRATPSSPASTSAASPRPRPPRCSSGIWRRASSADHTVVAGRRRGHPLPRHRRHRAGRRRHGGRRRPSSRSTPGRGSSRSSATARSPR